MKENVIKGTVAITGAVIASYFKALWIPLVVLVVLMIIDYATGVAKGYVNAELSSRIGLKGIIKKVGYIVLVAVGISVDFLIVYIADKFGLHIGFNAIFGCLVTIWLILNELISIMENCAKLGVPVPKFLTSIVGKLKVVVEEKGGDTKDES